MSFQSLAISGFSALISIMLSQFIAPLLEPYFPADFILYSFISRTICIQLAGWAVGFAGSFFISELVLWIFGLTKQTTLRRINTNATTKTR